MTGSYRYLLVLALLLIPAGVSPAGAKQVVGATAEVQIREAGLSFVGRVDTGAETTSVNAKVLGVAGGQVEFLLTNARGERSRLRSKVVEQRVVKNAEGSERRYYVRLTIDHRGQGKTLLVNLNDRSASTYKLLLGRNWLSGSYLVDVDQP